MDDEETDGAPLHLWCAGFSVVDHQISSEAILALNLMISPAGLCLHQNVDASLDDGLIRDCVETVLSFCQEDVCESKLIVARSWVLHPLHQTNLRQNAATLLLRFPLSFACLFQLFCVDGDFQLPRIGFFALLQVGVLSSSLM